MPAYLVPIGEGIELAPQIGVLDGLPGAGLPAILFPAVNPALDAFFHILRIRVDIDGAAAFQAFEGADYRGQFHPVVGGVRLAAEQLFGVSAPLEQRAPTARTGIAFARTVGVDRNRIAHSIHSRTWRGAVAM